MRVVAAKMGTPQQVREEWTFDDLAAAHRALWLKEQMKQLKMTTLIESIAKGLKAGKKGAR